MSRKVRHEHGLEDGAQRERRAPAGRTPAEAQVHGYAVALLREHRVSACVLNAFGIEPTPGEPPLPV